MKTIEKKEQERSIHTNKNADLVYPKQELCDYVHRVAAIFNIATTRVTGSLAHIYDPGPHTRETTIMGLGHLKCAQLLEITPKLYGHLFNLGPAGPQTCDITNTVDRSPHTSHHFAFFFF